MCRPRPTTTAARTTAGDPTFRASLRLMLSLLQREWAAVAQRVPAHPLDRPHPLDRLCRLLTARRGATLWTDIGFSLALTRALLRADWGLTWEGPRDRLVPPVPNRLNYILWIEDLVASRAAMLRAPPLPGPVLGVDVGTGASCIFPLLGHAACGWNFAATEVDADSLVWATRNVAANALSECVTLSLVSPEGDVLGSVVRGLPPRKYASSVAQSGDHALGALLFATNDAAIRMDAAVLCWDTTARNPSQAAADFTMCNPPFFSSWEEAQASMAAVAHKSVCAGTPSEMVRPSGGAERVEAVFCHLAPVLSSQVVAGGEVAFVARMARESGAADLRFAVTWYTSMLGKASSVTAVLQTLRDLRTPTIRTTVLRQGLTTRWGVAWSWLPPCAFLDESWCFVEAARGGSALSSPLIPVSLRGGHVTYGAAPGHDDSQAALPARLVLHFPIVLLSGPREAWPLLPIDPVVVGRHELLAVSGVKAATLSVSAAGTSRPTGMSGKRTREAPAAPGLPIQLAASGVIVDVACARIEEFLGSPPSATSDPGCAVVCHRASARGVVALGDMANALQLRCIQAWRGCVVEVLSQCVAPDGPLGSTTEPDVAAEAAAPVAGPSVDGPLRLRFAFEVQMLVQDEPSDAEAHVQIGCEGVTGSFGGCGAEKPDTGVRPVHGAVAVCLLSSHDAAARAAFSRFADALERDTLRVSRKWRRMQGTPRVGPSTASTGTGPPATGAPNAGQPCS